MKYLPLFFAVFFLLNKASAQDWSQDTIKLNEISITIDKRPANYMALPSSVSAIMAKRVETEKSKTLRDLSSAVPNFYMPEYGSKLTAPVYIRGVGSRVNSPTVGLYVDHVPYFEKSAFAFDLSDISQIEVLRGPQGTLYGRNAMGGIINVVTSQPANYRYIKVTANTGGYGLWGLKVNYNEPLTKNLSLLVSGGYDKRGGFYTNRFSGKDAGSDETKRASLKIRYIPVKQLTLTIKSGLEQSHEVGYPYSPCDSNMVAGEINYNHESTYNRDMMDNSLTAVYKHEHFTITSASAMQYLKDNQDIDQDFMTADYYAVGQGTTQNQYSQELLFTNANDENIGTTAGLFAFSQHVDRTIDLRYGSDASKVNLVPGNGYIKNNNEKNQGVAAFGQLTVKKILGLIDLTLGIRYDNEWNDLHYIHNTFNQDIMTLKKDTVFKTSYSEWMPKASVRVAMNPNWSVYGTVSKGYRGGGFNTTFVNEQDQKYDAESLWSYEIGSKNAIIPERLLVSCALFYINWNNQQVSQRVSTGGNMYKNAGETYSRGFEVELTARPIKDLQLSGNLGYIEAKYDDFKPSQLSDLNHKGNYLPFVPRYTWSANANYQWKLKHRIVKALDFNLSTTGIGKLFWDDANEYSENPFALVNGSVGVKTRWFEVSVWGRNLFNKEYVPYRFYISNFKTWYAQKGNPLMAGLTLSVHLSGQPN